MPIIATNLTDSLLKIYIAQGISADIAAGESLDLLSKYTREQIAGNSDVMYHCAQGNIRISDGVKDLSFNDATDHIKGYQQKIAVDSHNKQLTHETSRKIGTDTYFTSTGDDPTNPTDVGNGGANNRLYIKHVAGEDLNPVYMDLNTKGNETYLHEGYIFYKGFDGDDVSLIIVPIVTPVESSVNTNYNEDQGILVPAGGNGYTKLQNDVDLTDPRGGLVFMPLSEEGTRPSAFWNADWNSSTNKFENIAPAPAGDGLYNIFTQETRLSCFVNKIMPLGEGHNRLESADSAKIGQGMRLKLILNVTEPDHDVSFSAILTLHRVRTV